ncbi:MAG: metal-dependent hydrolase [Candidatus Diapherotrites archaeon]|nr:metal-dependent hydrolase [Candidatus Diapherotrites archaeon]
MVKARFLGHSSFLISLAGTGVLIDPYFSHEGSEDLKRIVPSSAPENEFRDVSLILITHEHFDHFDKSAIEKIALKNNSTVMAHEEMLNQLKIQNSQKQTIKMNDTYLLRNIKIDVMPAHHPQSFYPVGYILSHEGKSIYHMGDTELMEEFTDPKLNSITLMLLPIGGTYTMDVTDAVKTVKSMKPDYAIPMHFNTFGAIRADPNEFKERIEKSIIKTKAIILKPGQEFEF